MKKRILRMFKRTAIILTLMCVLAGGGFMYIKSKGDIHVYTAEKTLRVVRTNDNSQNRIHSYGTFKESIRSF